MARVKICGITDLTIAQAVVEAGADAIGFVFAESRRKVTPDQARHIIRHISPFVTTVGVFVDEDLTNVCQIADYCGLDMVQLHGKESPVYCSQVNRPVLKAVSIATVDDLTKMKPYQHQVRGFLLDTLIPGQSGGTGQTFPWHLAQNAEEYGPIIVAGGLTPENVQQALDEAVPYGVDVSSGVETNGVKDIAKIREFVDRVRGYKGE